MMRKDKKININEEKFKAITENSSDVTIILNLEAQYTYVSPSVQKITGYETKELLGKMPRDHIHPDDIPMILKIALQTIKNLHKTFQIPEFRVKHKNGTWIIMEGLITNLANIAGINGMVANLRDITKRKKAEQKLKESEEKYRFLINNILDEVLETDLVGKITYVSPQAYNLIGYYPDEIIGTNALTYVHTDDLNSVTEAIRKTMKSNDKVELEFRLLHKDGHYITVSTRGNFVKVGKNAKIVALLRDITEIKKSEQELIKSEEKYRLILENANDLIAIINHKLLPEYVNEQAHMNLLGYSKDYMLNNSPTKYIHPDDIERVRKAFRVGFKDGIASSEFRMKHRNGTYIWIETKGKTFKDATGKMKALIISRDITERKIAAQKIKESEEKYRNAYDLANFYKDLFAHDMRNILQSIVSTADLYILFRDKQPLDNLRDVLEGIKKHAMRGATLIENVRKLSRLEEEEIVIKPTNVSNTLKEAVDFTYNSFQGRLVNIEILELREDLYILGNGLLLDAFENILNNAVKYNNNDNVKIWVRFSETQLDKINYAKLEFVDNGIGIVDAKKEIIFEKTKMKDVSRRGMGIGLSLVKKIIEGYGGKIWIEDRVKGEPSKGSNFIILLQKV